MSRTDKDRPYWVKCNEEATYVWHDHQRFGEERYKNVAVKDEKGNIVYDEEPVYARAGEIYFGGYNYSKYVHLPDHDREAVRREATDALFKARMDKPIFVGTRRTRRTERVLDFVVKDYCTEGEKYTRGGWHYNSDLPCTPYLEIENRKKFYVSDMSAKKHSYSRKRYSTERVTARDTLRNNAKRYNSGEDVDDWDEDVNLTAQHRHSMNWDLW
jgi:hypothetical protein